MSEKKSVLFVCLGNICRSPIAASVFRHLVKLRKVEDGWIIDSAGTGSWHVGETMDSRSARVLTSHGIDTKHTVRQVTKDDFNKFDYIFGMDESNIRDLKAKAPKNSKAKIALLGSYDPQGDTIIQDPYYDNDLSGFERCYEQCYRSGSAFLDTFK